MARYLDSPNPTVQYTHSATITVLKREGNRATRREAYAQFLARGFRVRPDDYLQLERTVTRPDGSVWQRVTLRCPVARRI